MKKVIIFNNWFSSAYNRLRNKLIYYQNLDEDALHDTYLCVLDKILSGTDIIDLEAYFIGCYRKQALIGIRREQRYCHLEDWAFTLIKEKETIPAEELAAPDKLAKDILIFVKKEFPHNDYQLFRFKNYDSRCTYKDLADYAGISQASAFKKVNAITGAIRANQGFAQRNSMLMAMS